MGEKFDSIVLSLEKFIEETRQLGIIAEDFQAQGQAVLNLKLNNLVEGLQSIDTHTRSLQNVMVPPNVFNYIDNGENPQLYTKDCIARAVEKEKEVTAKTNTYKLFHGHLLKELSEAFPQEMKIYRTLRVKRS